MQLMSIEDLAVYLGDSKRTIYNYIASGDCPPYIKISGKNIKFDRADVDAWLESKKVNPDLAGRLKPLPWAPRAKEAIKMSEEEARRQGLDHVGTEHLLLGILRVTGSGGCIILNELGITYDKALKEVARLVRCRPQSEERGNQ